MKIEATMTSKGQITLPVALRERLGLRAGDRVAFALREDGSFVGQKATLSLDGITGRLAAYAGPKPVGVDDIDAARAEEYANRAGQT